MHIKVLGPGCRNCHTLEARARQALDALGLTAEIEHVTDYADIATHGVSSTPALIVDDELVVSGRVPTTNSLQRLLTATRG